MLCLCDLVSKNHSFLLGGLMNCFILRIGITYWKQLQAIIPFRLKGNRSKCRCDL